MLALSFGYCSEGSEVGGGQRKAIRTLGSFCTYKEHTMTSHAPVLAARIWISLGKPWSKHLKHHGSRGRDAHRLQGSPDTISTFCNILKFGTCQRIGPIGFWKVTKGRALFYSHLYSLSFNTVSDKIHWWTFSCLNVGRNNGTSKWVGEYINRNWRRAEVEETDKCGISSRLRLHHLENPEHGLEIEFYFPPPGNDDNDHVCLSARLRGLRSGIQRKGPKAVTSGV